ncbi:DUF222 domain-containing protein [Actinocrispum sp. NPDC049592]|uniref:DUF222 domain-containing protein n=1 Tax=Actinocrispum sp. NPDC049592 TaxID=3154835 RepID=UPI003431B474
MFDTAKPHRPDPHAAIPIPEMTATQCLEVITHAQEVKSHYDAREAQALARFAELRQPTQRGSELAEGARDEVAMELGVSPHTAAAKILQARSLVTRLPATITALSDGKIDYKRAMSMNDLTDVLSNEDAQEVEQRVLAGGRRPNPTKFRDAVRYQVLKADPEGAERRRAEARLNRGVTSAPGNDSISRLTARLTAEECAAAHQRITLLAQRAKTPDKTMAECRADVLMDLIMGQDSERVDVQVHVTVPMTTLMGLNDHPGEISGYGPITADHARELARNATWRRVITDPTGLILETSPRRYPSPTLANHVGGSNGRCRLTGCTAPVEDSRLPSPGGAIAPGTVHPERRLCRFHKAVSSGISAEASAANLAGSAATDSPAFATIPEQRNVPPY